MVLLHKPPTAIQCRWQFGRVVAFGWLGGSVVERRSLTGELSLVYTGPAADG